MQITLTAGEVTRLQDSIKENENGIGADLDSFKQRVWTFLRTKGTDLSEVGEFDPQIWIKAGNRPILTTDKGEQPC